MATSLHVLRSASRAVLCCSRKHNFSFSRRHLLSSAYSCTEAWNKSKEDSSFGELSLSEFAVQIHEQLEKHGSVSAVDMNVFAHQLGEMDGDEEEADFVESILKRYNDCQDSFPPSLSTSHAVMRGYLTAGLASRLPTLISDPVSFGLFPNFYTINLVMDHFIKQKDFASAVSLAHHSTMQEDFSDPVNVLLSLHACTQYLSSLDSVDDIAPLPKEEPEGGEEEEEEEWIKVKYIQNPMYDDHFDIKDQRFLLGKTLMMMSESQWVPIPQDVRLNLKIIGAGLYHKFNEGLVIISNMLQSSSDLKISAQALDLFYERLQNVESRNSDEPEVELALRTVDDVIRKLLPSHEEKENLVAEFGKFKEQLVSSGKVDEDFSLDKSMNEFVTANISNHELSDIERQSGLLASWKEEREHELESQVYEMRKEERMEEMKRQIRELQEEEELFKYFDKEEDVRLTIRPEHADPSEPSLTINKI